ncbi:glycoside hydrolase family 32 protein [Vibrio sp. WXL103]|uniref:glycoside hydrolase family 32 protein n=1 Tax=Vibrio sp. WXL103 TaxID=3450710 RepID=UPI003EC759A2
MDFSNRQNRFVRLDEVSDEYLVGIRQQAKTDPYYPSYHIAPHHGLINDPNGLSFFNGEHHIFYQWFPLGPVHGLKHWYHVSTKDFVHYQDHGIAMYPDQPYDQHGCYTGVGVEHQGALHLFYTANLLDKDGQGYPSQALAVMDGQGKLDKKGVIVPFNSESYTQEFRDPVIVQRGDKFHMLIGAQTHDKCGCLALYSGDAIDSYQHQGDVDVGLADFGYMWECPNYYEDETHGVFIFSPQGVSSNSKYDLKNVFSVVYMLGEPIDFNNKSFNNQGHIELDKGFDFYAPQTYLDDKGRRILIGWLGNSKSEYPTDKNNWAHMLTLPRELTIDQDRLVQTPIKELESLRQSTLSLKPSQSLQSAAFELEVLVKDEFSITFANHLGHKLVFRGNREEFTLDRTLVSQLHAERFGTVRYAKRLLREQTIRIYVDHSSLEIFADYGKTTFTSRLFIQQLDQLVIEQGEGQLHYLRPLSYL